MKIFLRSALYVGFFVLFLSGCSDFRSSENANNALLATSIHEKCQHYEIVYLNELVPFEWDKVYFFPAYASAQQMYEKVGYDWADIPELTSEDQMAFVFMNLGKVTCSVFGYSDQFKMYSEKEELLSEDNPAFVVLSLKGGVPLLRWIDKSLVEGESCDDEIPDDLVGEWEYLSSDPWYARYDVTLTRDGLLYGDMLYKIETDPLMSEYGATDFSGHVCNGFAICQPSSEVFGRRSNSSLPDDTKITFATLQVSTEGDRLILLATGTIPLNNGEYIEFSNKGHFTIVRRDCSGLQRNDALMFQVDTKPQRSCRMYTAASTRKPSGNNQPLCRCRP